ncbi:MAG: hypothetical protein IPM69_04115 [Ignavibacteria bacterium]|nr:hypothetical protein [Ignavibacteria bacterium]
MYKHLIYIFITACFSLANAHTARSQKSILLISGQDLKLHNLRDSAFIPITNHINIIKLYLVDTTLYLVGFKGAKQKDIHRYAGQKPSTWSTSLTELLRNKSVDTTQLILVNDATTNAILESASDAKFKSTVRRYNETLTYYIDKKLQTLNINEILGYFYKKYKRFKPILLIQSVSSNFQNKCIVEIEMFVENKNKSGYTHTSYSLLVIYNLYSLKIERTIPIKPSLIESIEIVE